VNSSALAAFPSNNPTEEIASIEAALLLLPFEPMSPFFSIVYMRKKLRNESNLETLYDMYWQEDWTLCIQVI
jgi:hypothetical protein